MPQENSIFIRETESNRLSDNTVLNRDKTEKINAQSHEVGYKSVGGGFR
jgi:hypothetical protein